MIVIDPAMFSLPLTPAVIRLICDRHFGAGADGICYGPLLHQVTPSTMRFFNPDGSEAEKSGNGLRVFARYLWDKDGRHGRLGRSFTIAIHDETIPVQIVDDNAERIALNIGRLTFEQVEEEMTIGEEQLRLTVISIGNPHCVYFTDELDTIRRLGPYIEAAPHFPNRTNVQFVRVLDTHTIEIEIWERGAGYTLASGTSSCAAAGAAIKTGRCLSPVEVRMAGGVAQVTIDEAWQAVHMGTVSAIYHGTFSSDMIRQLQVACVHDG